MHQTYLLGLGQDCGFTFPDSQCWPVVWLRVLNIADLILMQTPSHFGLSLSIVSFIINPCWHCTFIHKQDLSCLREPNVTLTL